MLKPFRMKMERRAIPGLQAQPQMRLRIGVTHEVVSRDALAFFELADQRRDEAAEQILIEELARQEVAAEPLAIIELEKEPR